MRRRILKPDRPDLWTGRNMIANLGVNYRDAKRFAEAIPLLEEAYQASKEQPGTEWIATALLDAHRMAATSGGAIDAVRVVALVRELMVSDRSKLPAASLQLAGRLADFSRILLSLELWDAAEPLARECLTIREKEQPDEWTTFNTKSMLGGALLGKKLHAEAEPLLLAGYRGMKEREAAIPPPGRRASPRRLERLVQFYEATGNVAEAAAWRSTLEAARMAESKPAAPGDK